MDRMPTEVLNMIIGLIDEPDPHASQSIFRSLRLVNKNLSALVTPKVFHTMPLWISATSLWKLNSISENLQLSKYVHTIEFSPLQIKALSPTSASNEMIKDGLDDHFYTLNTSELGLVQYKGARARYQAEQEEFYAKDLAVKALTRTLKRLPNLGCFKIILRSRTIGSNELNKAFIKPSASDINGDYKKALSIAMHALVKGQPRITSLQLTTPPFPDNLAELRRDPQDMSLPCIDDPRYVASPMAEVFYFDGTPFRPLRAFRSLRELSITLPEFGSDADFILFGLAIVEYLGQASNLAVLRIINNPAFAGIDTALCALMEECLPSLRSLELGCFFLKDAGVLSALFKRHHLKLETINLWEVRVEESITHGDWPDILEDMKEWEWSALKMFMITECYDDEIEVDLSQFLTGRTDENTLVDY